MGLLFVLPLLATLGAYAVFVRAIRALEAESAALIASAERLAPVATAIGDAAGGGICGRGTARRAADGATGRGGGTARGDAALGGSAERAVGTGG